MGCEAPPPRNLVDQLNPSKPRGADYAHHITACPPGFKMPSTPLYGVQHFDVEQQYYCVKKPPSSSVLH